MKTTEDYWKRVLETNPLKGCSPGEVAQLRRLFYMGASCNHEIFWAILHGMLDGELTLEDAFSLVRKLDEGNREGLGLPKRNQQQGH